MSALQNIPRTLREEDERDKIEDELLLKASEMDALLTKELNQLSMNDRELTMEEIHGAHANKVKRMEESRLDSVLEQLQIELDAIQDERRRAYNIALGMNSTYVIERKFRTTFFRAESYDAKKAAIRMLHFLTYAREKFGENALLRPIRWDDMSDKAMAILEEGSMQILPARDNAGRLVLSLIADAGTGCPLVDRSQMCFYVFNCLAEDSLSQLLGVVVVFFMHNFVTAGIPEVEHRKGLIQILQAVPNRVSACHYCFPNTPFFHTLKAAFLLASGKESRTRSRFHIGTVTELVRYGLMEENPEALEKIVEIPHHKDYLFGKGQAIMKHQGNIALRALLKERLSCWENAAFKEKSSICWEIIHEVAQQGGRFLRDTPQGWFVEVEPDSVRKKVSIAFRDMLKRARRNNRGGQQQEKAQVAGVSSADTYLPFPITLDHAIQAQTYNDLNLSRKIPPKRQKVRTGEDDDFSEKMFCNFSMNNGSS
ncbi:hypothetical protein IV203_024320 [Nitzschia inconspicua]|uniref:DUF6824 domain-containing protein n=1 Tax=Nitzschia inconspicua TaxID=303405 RepID=A0A9K3KC15_9STRA|nr:hypothetical protein IV203_024320 [Nitzschia inconspicua]